MDDIGEAIAGAIAVVILAALVVGFILMAIPVALYGIAVYRGIRRLSRQTGQYALTNRSELALVGVGLVSVAAAAVGVKAAGLDLVWMLPAALPLFLGAAVLSLETWAGGKARPYVESVERFRTAEASLARAAARAEAAVREHATTAAAVEAQHGTRLAERAGLEGVIRDLSIREDAQIRSLQIRRWGAEVQSLPAAELGVRLAAVRATLAATAAREERIRLSLLGGVLRLEELRRQVRAPHRVYSDARGAIDRLQAELGILARQHTESRVDRERAEAALNAFRISRIVLD